MSEDSITSMITVATFCERTLDEKDGVPSLIRLIDRITFTPPAPQTFDAEGKPLEPHVALAFYIRLSSLNEGSEHELRLTIQNPLGEEKEIVKYPFKIERNKSGVNFRGDLTVGVKHAGFYWMRIYIDSVFKMQIPLEVVVVETPESD